MEPNELDKLKKVLSKNQYLLKVYARSSGGCMVAFPYNAYASRHKKPQIDTYNITDKGKNKHLIIKKSNRKPREKETICPSYATKINIFIDIIVNCTKINYDINLISYYDQNNKEITGEKLFDLIIPPIKCKEKEAKLYALFLNYVEGEDEDIEELAKKYKLEDGYKSMLDILEQGE